MELVNKLFEENEVKDIKNKINDVYKIEKTNDFKQELSIDLEPNILNVEGLEIIGNGEKVSLEFRGKNAFKIEAANGDYIKNSFWATGIKAKISGMMPFMYEESVCSCYYKYNNNILEVVMKNHNTPLPQSIIVNLEEGFISVNGFTIKHKK